MTIYRTVVSWLAFLFCAITGVWIGWTIVKEFMMSAGDILHGRAFSWGSSFPMRELAASMAMAVLALAIMAPWLQRFAARFQWFGVHLWFTAGWAEKLNIGGRWLLSIGLFFWTAPFIFLAIPSVCLIGPEVSQMVSLGPSAFIDAVFFPGGRESKPPYTLKLARFYVEKKRWDEAEEEYARMLSFYPEALEGWEERLILAFRRGGDADPEPRKILASAIKALKRPEDREAIHQRFTSGA